MTLADKLRDLENEIERDAPHEVELLSDISRMICKVETGGLFWVVGPNRRIYKCEDMKT